MIVRLDGDDSVRNPHVGTQVRVVRIRGETPGTIGDAQTRAAVPAPPSLATAPIVHVESDTVLAASCSGNR